MLRKNKTLYDTLGLSPDASEKEIKKALRDKAKQCHPDHHPNNAAKEDEFKAVSAAYKVLSDPRARRQYDATGEMPSGNDITAKAYGMIISCFKSIRDELEAEIFFKEPIMLMEAAFQRGRKEGVTKICQIRRQNKTLGKIIKKLKHKRQDASFLHNALMDEQRQNKATIQAIQNELVIIKKALELVKDYSFETEARAAQPYVGLSYFTIRQTGTNTW